MAAGPTPLKALRSMNPRLDLAYAEQLRALYKGGKTLLRNDRVMGVVFPKHALEGPLSYRERKSRAFYDNEMAMIINKMLATLAQDPLSFDDDGASSGNANAKEVPPYWDALSKDARAPGDSGSRKTLDEVVRMAVCEALVCGMGWMLCDLPSMPVAEDGAPLASSALDQERLGADRAYPVPYRVDQVLDWMDGGGTLAWVRTYEAREAARRPEEPRGDWTTHTWRVWDAESITTYQLVLDSANKDKGGTKWEEESIVPVFDVVPHTFGAVPWVIFDASTPDEPTLWIGDLLASRCAALFNLQNSDEWLRNRSNFQQLYEFLGTETSGPDQLISEAQENPNRASRSMNTRAPDVVQIRGKDDTAKFVSPSMDGAALNRQAIEEGRSALPRVTGQLAYMNDTSGAMLRRSGDSKQQDHVSEKVVNGEIGKRALAFATAIRDMLARGRGDSIDGLPALKGYENLDTEDGTTRMDEHVNMATAPIKSATLQIEHQLLLSKALLGDSATPDTMAKIREELESAITQEGIEAPPMGPDGGPDDEDLADHEADDEDVSWDDDEPKAPKAKSKAKPS